MWSFNDPDVVFLWNLAASGVKMSSCVHYFENAVDKNTAQPALGCEDDGLNFEWNTTVYSVMIS